MKPRFCAYLILGYLLSACGDLTLPKEEETDRETAAGRVGEPTSFPSSESYSSCANIVNGVRSDKHPAVVRLMGFKGNSTRFCTGTFVSPTAVITAAHCIDSSDTGGLYYVPGETFRYQRPGPPPCAVGALRAIHLGFVGGQINQGDRNKVSRDVAILFFPEGTSDEYLRIGEDRPAVGAEVTLVGFGRTEYTDAKPSGAYEARKHEGTAEVFAWIHPEHIGVGNYTEEESVAAKGAKAVTSFGDSGGPLIYEDEIVGVLSGGGSSTNGSTGVKTHFAIYVDINTTVVQDLIREANEQGAGIE